MQEVVFDLIQWAEARGRLEELLQGARSQNPGNLELASIARQLTKEFENDSLSPEQWKRDI